MQPANSERMLQTMVDDSLHGIRRSPLYIQELPRRTSAIPLPQDEP
jgi:hypothetical protein